MDGMKYIRFENGVIVVFSSRLFHADMANRVGLTCVSAGFVRSDELNRPTCSGQSCSLGVRSREEDTDMLRRQLGFDV